MFKFYQEPYLREMEVKVISKKGDLLKFDDTIFYPGGGGQPYDIGIFKGEGFVAEITEVKKLDDGIWHKVKPIDGEIGTSGKIEIDWKRRYYLMKSHTGEHIFYKSLENVMPVKFVKVEFSIPESVLFVEGEVTLDNIEKAEEIANSIIMRNLNVTTEIKKLEDVGETRIRRERIKEEEVRIVNVGNFDSSACSGIHVRSTGEIERIHIKRLKRSKYNEIIFLVSEEAVREIEREKNEMRRINHFLNEFENAYNKIKTMKENLDLLKENYYELTERMFNFNKIENVKFPIYYTIEELGEIRAIEKKAHSLIENEKCIVIVGRKSLERINIFNSTGQDLHLIEFLKEKNLKGGGKIGFMINVPRENFENIFNELIEKFKKI
ncbi:MAG: alanine--tRNA ligase-related protein [Thermoplasmata archaeon]